MSQSDPSPAGAPESGGDGAAVRFPPPFVPLIALVAGLGVQLVAPVSLPVSGALRWGLGLAGVGAGVGLIAAAFGLFQRTGQDPKPWLATPEIISTGVYAWTRNPMYLGMCALQAGLGVALANAWVVLLVPATGLVIWAIAIRHEEAYLEGKFGAAYTDYKASVRRWL